MDTTPNPGGAGTATASTITVELSQPHVEMEPGGTPVEVVATLQNLSNVVEQYSIEVTGLEADWFTAPVASVSLFPQDKDQVRISLHPPKRPGLRAGSYPFRVVARARGNATQTSAAGVLDVRGVAIYRIVDLSPRRLTARGSGTYRLEIANSGAADVRLGLEGADPEKQCNFRFPKGEPLVTAGGKGDYPVVVQPRKRPWIGPEKSYDFTISARPIDARGEPQVVSGQFTHKPMFRSFPIWPILKWVLIALVLLAVVIVLFAFQIPQEFGRRASVATAQACGGLRNVPIIGGMCPARAAELGTVTVDCSFQAGFKDFAEANPEMVGPCTTNVVYDDFGNGLQYSKKGALFWLKASNTVYFFTGDSLYAYVQDKPHLLDGSGAPVQ
jgi:hypothetical protein